MREIAIVTRGGEVMMIGGGSSGLGRLLTVVMCASFYSTTRKRVQRVFLFNYRKLLFYRSSQRIIHVIKKEAICYYSASDYLLIKLLCTVRIS